MSFPSPLQSQPLQHNSRESWEQMLAATSVCQLGKEIHHSLKSCGDGVSFSWSSEGRCGEANEKRLSQTDLVDVKGGVTTARLGVSDEVLSITFENIPYWSDTESKAEVCGTAATDKRVNEQKQRGRQKRWGNHEHAHTHAQVKALAQYTHIWGWTGSYQEYRTTSWE